MSAFWLKHMYSVLSALTRRPIHLLRALDYVAGIRFRKVYLQKALCHIVYTVYRLAFFSVKPFSFIWSIIVQSTLSRQIWTDMGLMYSHAEHQQISLYLHPGWELLLSCFYRTSFWLRQFLWGDHTIEEFAPSSLCVWSQTPWRNVQTRVSPRGFFARSPAKIWWTAWICDVVDRFHRKLFWFFLRIFSISGSMRLSSRLL